MYYKLKNFLLRVGQNEKTNRQLSSTNEDKQNNNF